MIGMRQQIDSVGYECMFVVIIWFYGEAHTHVTSFIFIWLLLLQKTRLTPLHVASRNCLIAIAELLIRFGADVHAGDYVSMPLFKICVYCC